MGRGSVRAGAPTAGTQAVAGVVNDLTAPRIIIFDPPVRPCWARLDVAVAAGTAPMLIKVNTEVGGVYRFRRGPFRPPPAPIKVYRDWAQ